MLNNSSTFHLPQRSNQSPFSSHSTRACVCMHTHTHTHTHTHSWPHLNSFPLHSLGNSPSPFSLWGLYLFSPLPGKLFPGPLSNSPIISSAPGFVHKQGLPWKLLLKAVHVCLISEEGGLHAGRLWETVWCPPFGTLACTRLFMTMWEVNKRCSVLGPSCSCVRRVLSFTSHFEEWSS